MDLICRVIKYFGRVYEVIGIELTVFNGVFGRYADEKNVVRDGAPTRVGLGVNTKRAEAWDSNNSKLARELPKGHPLPEFPESCGPRVT